MEVAENEFATKYISELEDKFGIQILQFVPTTEEEELFYNEYTGIDCVCAGIKFQHKEEEHHIEGLTGLEIVLDAGHIRVGYRPVYKGDKSDEVKGIIKQILDDTIIDNALKFFLKQEKHNYQNLLDVQIK